MNLTMGSVMNIARYLKSCGVELLSSPSEIQHKSKPDLEKFKVSEYFDSENNILYSIHRITKSDGSVVFRFLMEDTDANETINVVFSPELEPIVARFEAASRTKAKLMPYPPPDETRYEKVERITTYEKGAEEGRKAGLIAAREFIAGLILSRKFNESIESLLARDESVRRRYEKAMAYINRDAMIGKKWNSRYNEAEIVGERGDTYLVRYGNTIYFEPKATIERTIQIDEADYASNLARIEAEKLASEKEAKQKEARYEDYGFTDGITGIKRERILLALNKIVNWNGVIKTRKEQIVDAVNSGSKIKTMRLSGKDTRVLTDKNGDYLIDESSLTKTGMDFAEYLINRGK